VERAVHLTRWVGDDRRPVAAGKVLRPSDIAAAGAAVGVEVPRNARSAALLPALHRPWCVAVAAGLLVIGTVTAGPALPGWASADESDVLVGWLAGLRAVCRVESGKRHPHSVAILALVLLDVLSADGPSDGRDLRRAVHERITADDVFNDGCDDKAFRQYLSSAADEPLGGLLTLLRLFGAVTAGSGEAAITPLGRWAVSQLRSGMPHSASPQLSAAEVIDLLDEPALPAWRDLAGEATIGPHGRAVLANWDEQDPALAVRPEDGAWLAVEAAAAALAGSGSDEALTLVYEGMPGSDLDSRIAAVGASGHPQAEILARALTTFMNLELARDEFGTRVAGVLSAPKQKIVYRYDLGADWRHEILLEEVGDNTGERDPLVCVGFGGDSPVEYPYEDEPEEPAPLDLDAVNRRLAELEGDQ
jgi:hypothetical protein